MYVGVGFYYIEMAGLGVRGSRHPTSISRKARIDGRGYCFAFLGDVIDGISNSRLGCGGRLTGTSIAATKSNSSSFDLMSLVFCRHGIKRAVDEELSTACLACALALGPAALGQADTMIDWLIHFILASFSSLVDCTNQAGTAIFLSFDNGSGIKCIFSLGTVMQPLGHSIAATIFGVAGTNTIADF